MIYSDTALGNSYYMATMGQQYKPRTQQHCLRRKVNAYWKNLLVSRNEKFSISKFHVKCTQKFPASKIKLCKSDLLENVMGMPEVFLSGDTAYSKKWVLSVLLHMMQDLKNADQKEEKDGDNEEESSDESIDTELEEELCELWDMTMDSVSCTFKTILF